MILEDKANTSNSQIYLSPPVFIQASPVVKTLASGVNVTTVNCLEDVHLQNVSSRIVGFTPTLLELGVKLCCAGVTQLVFEFPTRTPSNSSLFEKGYSLFEEAIFKNNSEIYERWESGQRFPCKYGEADADSNASGTGPAHNELFCIYEKGAINASAPSFGTPHRIVVTNFIYTPNKERSIQFLIKNPTVPNRALSLYVYAFGNTTNADSPPAPDPFINNDQLLGWSWTDRLYEVVSQPAAPATNYSNRATLSPQSPPGDYNDSFTSSHKIQIQVSTDHDVTIVKFPIRYNSIENVHNHEDICWTTLPRNQYFLVAGDNTHEIHGYYIIRKN